LISLKRYVTDQNREPTDIENRRFLSYVKGRDEARIELFSAFNRLDLYFSSGAIKDVNRFRKWDQKQTVKTIDSLPDIEEWQNYSQRILSNLRKEIIN